MRRHPTTWSTAVLFGVIAFGSSCKQGGSAKVGDSAHAASATTATSTQLASDRPDEAPALATAELPFKYPAALYARKVQGNVTLKLFIDRDGHVVNDSTRVEEPSGYPALDSAALTGSARLRFVPAKVRGEPMPFAILFPVYFRHPEARPLPGDSILKSGKSG